jgi:uncharacterized protein YjbJ (UPF0337 family)
MDWDRVKLNWMVHASDAQDYWDKLTETDLEEINGHRDRLVMYLQDLYGFGKDKAEAEADNWVKQLSDSATLVTTKIEED